MKLAASGAHHQMTRPESSVIGTSIVTSAVLLGFSFVGPTLLRINRTSHAWLWTEALLLNLGAAVLLIVPIEWLSARLRRRVEAVDERQTIAVEQAREAATASVAALKEEVSSLDTRVKDLTELSQSVAAGAARRAQDDEHLFSALASDVPTSGSLGAALSRARDRQLTSDRGVRVPVGPHGSLRLRFSAESDASGPVVRLESITGVLRREWIWSEGTSAEAFLSALADCLDGEGERAPLDVGFVFARLSESLLSASKLQDVRPLVELCPPQWAVTDFGIVATDPAGYTVTHDRTDRIDMDVHVRKKTWIDMDSYELAFEIASYLFPVTEQQWQAARR